MLSLMTTDLSLDDSSADALSKEELLARAALGDELAFGELYDQIAPRVLGLVKRLLVDHAQSEEVTQEIFLEIWQTATRYEATRGGASTWIMTMAHRRAVDRIRSSQAGRDRDSKIGIRDMAVAYDHVAESVEVRIEHERVEKAMSRLTQLQRQAVSLAYYGGYTHSEVAGMLKIPLGTVKTRLRDGLIRLREELGVTS
ncbi:RNA polymerase ECF family sigma subunit [Cryobacterium psychrophilum]|uniref:Sigma-70 family RNA polymerase sigma factor n=2 Tax=Cryobacterium psychrophilum TaxID=41988 RepID=A0A4Y8KXZ9_9MICO|nr:ECF RNA polymerase sigma factor SigK [Cryobacterium psychrophilum]TDW29555.1 RNA polymerase ECF family sigma subunit [Cryobacterium psychrophilum]TFD81896.1 sigma-70 family RNA polymerase sigma factor [Cryobacterium psychrophilum]